MENKVVKTQPEKITAKSLKNRRDRDREMIRGIFKNYECAGGALSFVYRAYKDDPIERYDFVDGQIYTIPLGVARHLNSNCWYPVFDYYKDGNDTVQMSQHQPTMGGMWDRPSYVQRVRQKVHRYGFQSLELFDPADLGEPTNLVEVENHPRQIQI